MKNPADPERAKYLELCEELFASAQLMRNFAMKPGNVWLAKGELAKVSQLVTEIETVLEEIKKADS